MPTPLKPDGQRARRNKSGTEAVLPAQTAAAAPALPVRPTTDPWEPAVVTWWETLTTSPVVALYTPLDWMQALDLLPLRQMYAKAPSVKLFQTIQKASIGLGLDNADRRRNGWKAQVTPRPPSAVAPLPEPEKRPQPKRLRDPRKVLRTVAGGRR